ncbi:hypothetical protein PG996_016133 [Apiospora saccharicola]|uniref:Tat pathway signal sequence n=1 Tax=Apiospora saccharicola TaxID=335842 RepID=A0ABR1TN85_9PEZI
MDKIRYSEEDEAFSREGGGDPSMSADTQGLISEAQVTRSNSLRRCVGHAFGGYSPFWVVVLPWTVAILSICSAIYLDYQLRAQQTRDATNQDHYSPASHLVQYTHREFTMGLSDNRTRYEAAPSPEADAAWNDLYSMGIVAISRDEASRLHEKTQPLPHDPEGRYVVSMSVFHDLHCLNRLRKQLFPGYYTQFRIDNRTESDVEHIMHCIDSLRQSTLCHADLTWSEGHQAYKPKIAGDHVCKNLEAIQDWARDHAGLEQWDTKHRAVNDPLDSATWAPGWHP